jgi:hypothetical protein
MSTAAVVARNNPTTEARSRSTTKMPHMPKRGRPIKTPLGPALPFRDEYVDIAPDMAREMLEHFNSENRPLSSSRSETLARVILAGDWDPNNAQALVVDWNGQLINGQHRLLACVLADQPIRVLVAFGRNPDSRKTIDTIMKVRDNADLLALVGEAKSKQLSSLLTLVRHWDAGRRDSGLVRAGFYFEELARTLEARPDVRESLTWSHAVLQRLRLTTPRAMAFAHHIMGRVDAKARERFFEALIEGTGLKAGDPVLLLRNRLMRRVTERNRAVARDNGQDSAFVQILMIFQAWNHWRAGSKISHLRVPRSKAFGKDKITIPDPI